MPEFKKWGSIPRLHKRSPICTISEKIDGTNAQVFIENNDRGVSMYAGSRNRWLNSGMPVAHKETTGELVCADPMLIPKDQDNYGFAKWVVANAADLFTLGEGAHYGEWYGQGIQRGYGMEDKKFALFNVRRPVDTLPSCVQQVPVLYEGVHTDEDVGHIWDCLKAEGSKLVPGFMNPEGIVVFFHADKSYWKATFDTPNGKWSK